MGWAWAQGLGWGYLRCGQSLRHVVLVGDPQQLPPTAPRDEGKLSHSLVDQWCPVVPVFVQGLV